MQIPGDRSLNRILNIDAIFLWNVSSEWSEFLQQNKENKEKKKRKKDLQSLGYVQWFPRRKNKTLKHLYFQSAFWSQKLHYRRVFTTHTPLVSVIVVRCIKAEAAGGLTGSIRGANKGQAADWGNTLIWHDFFLLFLPRLEPSLWNSVPVRGRRGVNSLWSGRSSAGSVRFRVVLCPRPRRPPALGEAGSWDVCSRNAAWRFWGRASATETRRNTTSLFTTFINTLRFNPPHPLKAPEPASRRRQAGLMDHVSFYIMWTAKLKLLLREEPRRRTWKKERQSDGDSLS